MEFGIGLVAGGVLTGFAIARGGAAARLAHRWLARAEAAVKQKMDAKAASLRSKL